MDITDLTGSTAAFGIPILDGAKVAAAQLNAKGGILGHRIVVKSMNDPSNDPTTAINDLQSVLASGQQINLIYPGLTSAVGEALLPSVNQHNILAIGSLSAPTLNDPAKYPNLFLMATQSDQNVPPFTLEAKKRGFHKVAILYTANASDEAEFTAYKQSLATAGVTVVGSSFPKDALDMTPELESLRSQHPDALVVASLGAQTLYIVKDRAAIGWTDTPAYTDQGAGSTPMSSLPASDLTDFFIESQAHDLNGNQSAMGSVMAKFIKDMQTMGFGKDLTTVSAATASLGYNAIELANTAANQAGSIDTAKMVAALNHLKQPKSPLPWVYFGSSGQFGCFCFTATNHRSTITDKYFTYVHPGSLDSSGYYQPGS